MKPSSDSSIESQYNPETESDTSNELVRNFLKRVPHRNPKNDNTSTANYYLENSTSKYVFSDFLSRKANALFIAAREDVFEDGMNSNFSRNLIEFIFTYGHAAMEMIIPIIFSKQTNTDISSEALRVVGRINHKSTHRDRLWLLERGLYSSSARIRDGAILGLAFLNDPYAIAPLTAAIARESLPELRQDMEQVLAQLEGTDGIFAKENTEK